MFKAPKSLTGVLVCVPAFGQNMTAQTGQALYNIAQALTAYRIKNTMCWLAMADIAELRSTFLTFWYDGNPAFSHLLMVDADMGFPSKLLLDMLAFDKPVTGCLYARRQWPAVAVGKTLTADDTVDDVRDGFLKVAGVGAGVLLIRRDAIDLMLKKHKDICDYNISWHPARPTFDSYGGKRMIRAFEPMVKDGLRLSEDLSFCERWRDSGGEIWANVHHLIDHIGPFNYAIRYADYLEQKAVKAA